MIDIKSFKVHGPEVPLSEYLLREVHDEEEFFEVRFQSLASGQC